MVGTRRMPTSSRTVSLKTRLAPFADLKSNLNSFVKDLTSRVEPGDIEKRYTNDTNTSTP